MNNDNIKQGGRKWIIILVTIVFLLLVAISVLTFFLINNIDKKKKEPQTTTTEIIENSNMDEYDFEMELESIFNRIESTYDEDGSFSLSVPFENYSVLLEYDGYSYNNHNYKIEFKGELIPSENPYIESDLRIDDKMVITITSGIYDMKFFNNYLILLTGIGPNNFYNIIVINMDTKKVIDEFFTKKIINDKQKMRQLIGNVIIENDYYLVGLKDGELDFYYLSENCDKSSEYMFIYGTKIDTKKSTSKNIYEEISSNQIVGETVCN